jgi:hypothetical protein
MARNEADREDLIREAVALPERVELQVSGFVEPVLIGFRDTSAMSVFVGQDRVYQFDPEGRLRRAYVDGFLYRSEHNTLARLQRVRTATETRLLRHDLDAGPLEEFRTAMTESLRPISSAIRSGTVKILRAVPDNVAHCPKIAATFEMIFQADPWLSRQIRRRVIKPDV